MPRRQTAEVSANFGRQPPDSQTARAIPQPGTTKSQQSLPQPNVPGYDTAIKMKQYEPVRFYAGQ